MLREVFAECARVLEPGGRIAVNVANLGRKPYRNLAADVTAILASLGLLLRGEIVWRKADGATGSCAWGSFRSPANPVLRDMTERIVVASKGRFDRSLKAPVRKEQNLPHRITIGADEFMESTLDVWHFASESAKRVGHPAPFPVALPERLIHMHTYADELVLDPFLGSGSTLVAAARTGRRFVGYDLDPAYCELAMARVADELAEMNAVEASRVGGSVHGLGSTKAPATEQSNALERPGCQQGNTTQPAIDSANIDPVTVDPAIDACKTAHALVAQFTDNGLSTNEMAKRVLHAAGFTIEKSAARIPDTGMILPFVFVTHRVSSGISICAAPTLPVAVDSIASTPRGVPLLAARFLKASARKDC